MIMYFGPETMMPLASAAAAVAGALLLFWHKLVGFARMAVRRVRKPTHKGDAGKRDFRAKR